MTPFEYAQATTFEHTRFSIVLDLSAVVAVMPSINLVHVYLRGGHRLELPMRDDGRECRRLIYAWTTSNAQ